MSDSAILFMCIANSARSQIAEALARKLAPPAVEVFSAGTSPSRIHPFAVRVLDEIGLDTSRQFPKTVEHVPRDRIDTVITLCEEEVCPTFPGSVRRLHWPFQDPAAAVGSDLEVLEAFRRVRDGLEQKLATFFRDRAP